MFYECVNLTNSYGLRIFLPVSRLLNLTGKVFGQLTALCRDERTKGRKVKWFCLCTCGSMPSVYGSNLTRGFTQRCLRCKAKAQKLKIPQNARAGSRTVLKTTKRGRRQYWLMQCDCGHKAWVEASRAARSTKCINCWTKSFRLAIPLGKQYGSRVVLKTKIKRGIQWCLMQCDCGDEKWIIASQQNFSFKHCKTCGNVKNANKMWRPHLTSRELQRLLDLHIYKKQSLKQLQEAR